MIGPKQFAAAVLEAMIEFLVVNVPKLATPLELAAIVTCTSDVTPPTPRPPTNVGDVLPLMVLFVIVSFTEDVVTPVATWLAIPPGLPSFDAIVEELIVIMPKLAIPPV